MGEPFALEVGWEKGKLLHATDGGAWVATPSSLTLLELHAASLHLVTDGAELRNARLWASAPPRLALGGAFKLGGGAKSLPIRGAPRGL